MQFSKRLDRFGEEIFAALNNRRMELEAQGMKIYNKIGRRRVGKECRSRWSPYH